MKRYALTTLAMILIATGCRSVPDEAPVEQPLPQTFADLLPASTVAVIAIDPVEVQRLAGQVPGAGFVVQTFTSGMPPVFQDLMARDALEGRDTTRPFYVVLTMSGHEGLVETLRLGAPLASVDLLPQSIHTRLIVPADNAATLANAVLASCEARNPGCGEFAGVEAFGAFVTIDMVESATYGASPLEWEGASSVATARPADTIAFRAFAESGAAVAFYGRFDRAYDVMALRALNAAHYFVGVAPNEESRRQALTLISIKAAAEYLFDSPGAEEFEDVTVRIEHKDGSVTIDSILSLTAYGQKVTEALELNSSLAARTLADPAIDVRWGFDLTGAIKASQRPLWAQEVPGMTSEAFANMMDWKTKQSRIGFPLAVLRAPVTGYALFDKFVGPQTTPAEFAQIRGFWMQFGVAGDNVGVAAMGLDLPVGADVVAFKEFADVALLPFGRRMETRSVERSANLEFQATTGLPVEDIFAEQVETIGPGFSFTADLHRLFALIEAIEKPQEGEELSVISSQARMISPAFLPAKYRKVFAQGLVGEGQGVMRVQFGADAPKPIALRGDGPAPRQISERSPCLYRALEFSVLAVEELEHNVTSHEAYLVLIEDVASGLDELARECSANEPDAARQITKLATQWREAR
jgi:hypothetical protein